MPTQKQIAEHLDLSQAEVSGVLAELGIAWKRAGLDEIRVAYIRRIRAVASGHKSRDGTADLVKERVLTEQVERQLRQLELAEKTGELVNLKVIEPPLQQMVAAFKSELLARDDKVKAEIDAFYGTDIDLQILEDHTRAALAQLARYDPDRKGFGPPPRRAARAARADDDDAVGARAQEDVGEGNG